MKKQTLKQLFKSFIAGIGFKLFIWGNETTEERYWKAIQEQENAFDERKKKEHEAILKLLSE